MQNSLSEYKSESTLLVALESDTRFYFVKEPSIANDCLLISEFMYRPLLSETRKQPRTGEIFLYIFVPERSLNLRSLPPSS